jgi:O-methyltransferase involved in polyketide biosynthesis
VSSSDAISPTAHYTGYVWARNGLSHPELETVEGRILFETLRPMMIVNSVLGQGTLEAYLLARHRAIDQLLEQAIEERGVTQVIEVAAGLSPRGWRFTQRYGERITYIEADLPAMAARKRRALERMGSLSDHHRVEDLDALREDGPGSLPELAQQLDHREGLAIITEGLLGYLPRDAVEGIWARFAGVLSGFAAGIYTADIYVTNVHIGVLPAAQVRAFRLLLSAFVRGRVYMHFRDPGEAVDALKAAGFKFAEVRPAAEIAGEHPEGIRAMTHILEASTT